MRTDSEIDAYLDAPTQFATDDDIDAFLDSSSGQPAEEESTGMAGTTVRGIAQGALGLASGGASAVRWLGDVSAGPYVAEAGDKASDFLDDLSQKIAPTGPDFEGTFVENPSVKRAAYIIAQAAPSLGVAIATGMAAGPVAAGSVLGLAEGAPQYEEARDAGKSVGEASTIGAASTVGTALLEYLPIAKFLKGFKGGIAARAVKGGATEATQEVSQQIWQNILKKYGYDKTHSLAEGLVESAIAGGGTGAPLGAMFRGMDAEDINTAKKDIDKQVVDVADKLESSATIDDDAADAFLDEGKDPKRAALEKAWAEHVEQEKQEWQKEAVTEQAKATEPVTAKESPAAEVTKPETVSAEDLKARGAVGEKTPVKAAKSKAVVPEVVPEVAPEAAAKVKEPWEMTRDEWEKTKRVQADDTIQVYSIRGDEFHGGKGEGVYVTTDLDYAGTFATPDSRLKIIRVKRSSLKPSPESDGKRNVYQEALIQTEDILSESDVQFTEKTYQGVRGEIKNPHKMAIKQAIKEGKIKSHPDYPDLTPAPRKAPKAKKVTPTIDEIHQVNVRTSQNIRPMIERYGKNFLKDYRKHIKDTYGDGKIGQGYLNKVTPKLATQKTTDTPEFKKWFGKSKVVDGDGEPLVVYHGTKKDFNVYEKQETSYLLDRLVGFHFAVDPKVSNTFTTDSFRKPVEGGSVLPVYLNATPMKISQPKNDLGVVLWDETAVAQEIYRTVFAERKDLFVKWIKRSRGVTNELANKVYDKLKKGKEVNIKGEPVVNFSKQYTDNYNLKYDFGSYVSNFDSSFIMMDKDGTQETIDEFKRLLKDKGYDALEYTNTSGNEVKGKSNPKAYIVFDSNQIKSATGNKGTFDSTNPDIRFATKTDRRAHPTDPSGGAEYTEAVRRRPVTPRLNKVDRRKDTITAKQVAAAFEKQGFTAKQDGDNVSVSTPTGSISVNVAESVSEDDGATIGISYGREAKPGEKVVGSYFKGRIKLKRGSADRFILSHELFHHMKAAKLFTKAEEKILARKGSEEKQAQWVEKNLRNRNVAAGVRKLLQKVADFLDSLANVFVRTERGIVRDVESGRVLKGTRQFNVANERGMVEVWHGSPHKFDKFSTGKMGTGEGAQAFGWGLYFTDKKSIARHYANKLSPRPQDSITVLIKDNLISTDMAKTSADRVFLKNITSIFETWNNQYTQKYNKDKPYLLKSWGQKYLKAARHIRENRGFSKDVETIYDIFDKATQQDYLDALHEKNKPKPTRNLYKVTLNKGRDDVWLDWDKKIPDDKLNKIKKQIAGEKLSDRSGREIKEAVTGEDLYRVVANEFDRQNIYELPEAEASLFLKRAGIDGIRYPTESLSGKPKRYYANGKQLYGGDLDLVARWALDKTMPEDVFERSRKQLANRTENQKARDIILNTKRKDFSAEQEKHNYVVFDESAVEVDEHIQYATMVEGTQYALPQSNTDRARSALGKYLREFMHYIVDKNIVIQNVQRKLKEVSADINVFVKETMRPKRTAAFVQRVWDDEIHPLITKMAKYGVNVGDLELYKHALHAPEANNALRKANAKLQVEKIINVLNTNGAKTEASNIEAAAHGLKKPGEWLNYLDEVLGEYGDFEDVDLVKANWEKFAKKPSGMSDKESAEILKKYAGDKKMEELGAMLDQINNNRLQLLFDSGQLPKEEFDAIRSKYKHYVPLYREGYNDDIAGSSRGLKPSGRMVKVRGGSTRKVVDIFANSVSQYEKAINVAEKAISQRALYGLAKKNAASEIINIEPVKKSPRHDKNGNIRMYPDLFNVGDNEMRLMVDGKQYLISVQRDDRDAMLMMRTLKAEDGMAGPIVNTLAKLNRFLAKINTTWSPEFIISNFVRDIQTAGINIQDTGVKGKSMFGGARKAIQAIYAVERGKPKGTELEKMYARFKKAGGKIGWADVHGSVQNLSKKITAEIEMQAGKRPTRKRIKEWTDLIEDANTSIENGVRLHTFKLAVEQGKSDEKAAQIASDLTVDFTKKGAAGPVINSLYLFANAGIQGSYRIWRAASKSRKVQKTLAGIVGAGFTIGLLNSLAGEDDDGEDYFNKIDDFVRERNMIIMLPGTKGKYAKIPLPWGYNVFWNLGTEMSRAITKEKYSPLASAGRMAVITAGAFNPVQSGTLLQTLSPTVSDPFVQVSENKNWFGGDLMPARNKFERVPTPDSQRFWKSSTKLSQWTAQGINALTGGDKVKAGIVDVSPETLDLLVDTAGGSAFRFVKDTLGLPLRMAEEGATEWHKIPFVRRVAGNQPAWANSRIYYENVEDILITKERLKVYKGTEEYKNIYRATKTQRKLMPLAEAAEKQLRALRKRRKAAEVTGNKAEVNRIKSSMNTVYNRFNKAYNKEN